MDSQAKNSILTIHPPIPNKQLGKYINKKGVYLIRLQGIVIYIGNSKNIYKAASRLFHKGGVLHAIDVNKVTFEIVFSSLRRPSVEGVLKSDFLPTYNHKCKLLKNYTEHEKRQAHRIRTAYQLESRFSTTGDHQTDSKLTKK